MYKGKTKSKQINDNSITNKLEASIDFIHILFKGNSTSEMGQQKLK